MRYDDNEKFYELFNIRCARGYLLNFSLSILLLLR